MSRRGVMCVFVSVFSLYCCESSAKRNEQRFRIQELTVTADDLKHCDKQMNVCVMSRADCLNTPHILTSPENFVNTSCHYLKHEESFTCRWIQGNDVRTQTSTFVFSRERDFISCPSILNEHSSFYVIIKSVNVMSQREIFSDVYPVILQDIVQTPRPVITSVNSTDTSLTVTWSSGEERNTKCKIRSKLLNTDSWTETMVLDVSVHIIVGLQPFTEYSLMMSCCHEFSGWSDWSSDTHVMTSESLPTAAPLVSCYLVLDRNSGSWQLGILWKALDSSEARGIIRGYEVSYEPIKRLSLRRSVHTSDLKLLVSVTPEEYDITVTAYNSAGRSPNQRLAVNARHPEVVFAVKGLWVSSEGLSLRLRWEQDFTTVNVSEFAIEWRSSSNTSSGGWKRVNGSTFTALLTEIQAGEVYIISVYAVAGRLCGPPVSLSADVQHGTLIDLVGLHLISVSKSSLTVKCVWKEAQPSVHVLQHTLLLKGKHHTQHLTVFPHQTQHLFYNLQANEKYTVYVHTETRTGNFCKASLDVNTPLLGEKNMISCLSDETVTDHDEIIKCCVALVLLILCFGIFSVLTKTMCKGYFSNVANPEYSLIGRWLLNTAFQQGNGKICVLRLENVFMMDQQKEKNIIHVERRVSSDEEDEDLIPSEISSEGTTRTTWRSSSDYVENSPSLSNPSDYIDLPIITALLDYGHDGQILCESLRSSAVQ